MKRIFIVVCLVLSSFHVMALGEKGTQSSSRSTHNDSVSFALSMMTLLPPQAFNRDDSNRESQQITPSQNNPVSAPSSVVSNKRSSFDERDIRFVFEQLY